MSLSERPVGEFLAALGERTPTPASGAATALTAALAAALVELAGRFAGDEEAVVRAKALWSRLSELADEDAAAYTAFMADRSEANREQIIAVPLEIAACADEAAELAERVRTQLRTAVVGDAEAARELARAAARVARRLAELNASRRLTNGSCSDAEGGNRTHTPRRAMDFESIASANSATSARGVNGNRAHGIGLRVSRQ